MIFFFSATGNSLYAARRLAEILGERTVVPIAESMDNGEFTFKITDAEKVGIVTPVYFYGMPLNVEEFIRRLRIEGTPRAIYTVVTYGTRTATASKQAGGLLKASALRQDAAFCVRMPENYIPIFKAPEPDEQKAILAAADRRIDEIAQQIMSGVKGDFDDGKGPLPKLTEVTRRPFYIHGRSTRRFRVTTSCARCGRCAKMCPSHAIEMRDGRPVWTESRCLRCMACLNRCPQHAIEFGLVTNGRRRYVNPNVRL
jgi:ferredoxin